MKHNKSDIDVGAPADLVSPEKTTVPTRKGPGVYDSEMHVLFLNNATKHSNRMIAALASRGVHVTDVRDQQSVDSEWNLGIHNLLLVDHSVPIDVRLSLLRQSNKRHHSIPIMMIFDPEDDLDAALASEHGALACVFRDEEGEYLTRVAALIESYAKQCNFAVTECLPLGQDEDFAGLVLELAAEVSGKANDIPPAYLTVLGGPDVGRTIQIDSTLCVIGRDPSCQLCLTDQAVSRFHTSVKQLPDGVTEIKDLNSSNGIFLHGKRVARAYLKGGDEILVGKNTLIKFQR